MNKFYHMLGLLSLQGFIAMAQQQHDNLKTIKYSLPQVWDSVSLYSKSINLEKLNLLQNAERLESTRAEKLPDISLDGEYAKFSKLPQYENGLFHQATYYPLARTSYSLGTTANMFLYNGSRLKRNMEAAAINQDLIKNKVNLTTGEIKLLASSYYLNIIRDQKFLQIIARDINEQEKVIAQIRVFYKNGVVLKSDVLRAELKVSKQKLQYTQIHNDIALHSQKLGILMGLPEETMIDPSDSINLTEPALDSYENYVSIAMNNAFELNISRQEQSLRKLNLKLVKANILPEISVFANYLYSYPQGRLYPYALSLYSLGTVGLKASYPLSALYKNKHRVAEAALELRKSALEHSAREDEIKEHVKQDFLQLQEDIERIRVSKKNIIQATENLRILKSSYLNQTALMTDYLDADVQLLESRFDLTVAEIEGQFHFYQLQKTIGKL
ncbi:MAG: TolC family protein [Pedobacter sp.]|uniref:TolC family protein n=1 Tax=Pedobacter sp. TaxID=1411316 RepID=UPI003395F437